MTTWSHSLKSVQKLACYAAMLLGSLGASAQTKLNCQIDPISGLPEATLDWQNTLGRDRADSWCRRLLMADQVTPADTSAEVADYVSLRGHARGSPLRRGEPLDQGPDEYVPLRAEPFHQGPPPSHVMPHASLDDYVQIKQRQ